MDVLTLVAVATVTPQVRAGPRGGCLGLSVNKDAQPFKLAGAAGLRWH